ncbi:MAG: metallophosphoesterase [Bacillota bacterium]
MAKTALSSTVILGDIHGRMDVLEEALEAAGLSTHGRWTGGESHLVQLGDLIDRGPASLSVLDFMMRLESEAEQSGGSVTTLLGNHELMALVASFPGTPSLRPWWFENGGRATLHQWRQLNGDKSDEDFFQEFGPNGRYGEWLSRRPVVALAQGHLCSHAGIDAGELDMVKQAVEATLSDPQKLLLRMLSLGDPVFGSQGPFWRRNWQFRRLPPGVQRQVIGHTPGPGVVVSAGGRLINLDVGSYQSGRWAALVLPGSSAIVHLSTGRRVILEPGVDMTIEF